jgi:hypothetical protein
MKSSTFCLAERKQPGAETTNIVLVTQQQEIARLNRRKEALDLTSGAQHRATNYVVRARRGGGGSDQNQGWLRVQQILQRSGYRSLLFLRSEHVCGIDPHSLQPLAHNRLE